MAGLIVRARAVVTTEFVVYSDANKTDEVLLEIASARLGVDPTTVEIIERTEVTYGG